MDRIFGEIKKAIEEEMRNAESGPPPGGGRSQAGGGRRAQEYADWLKEEQDRLRGGGSQPASRPEPLEEVQMGVPAQPQSRSREPREDRPRSRVGHGQKLREQSEGSPRQQRENRSRREEPSRASTQRAQPRQQSSQSSSAYQPRTASPMGRQIERLLRSPNGLRQAFLLREIISKPVSLRDKDDHLIS